MNPAIRTIITTAFLIAALLLPGGAAGAASQTPSTVRTDDSAAIDDWVEERMDARSLPGVAVAVVRDGDVVHLAGYGAADETDRTVTPDTPFILGSVSKPFTAVVVGQLVEEGVLAWDEPVWPYLSHLVDAAPEGFETVTVEQLVTHTGGLNMSVGTAGAVTIHQGPDALDRRVDDLLSHPLSGSPGQSFEYSNAGFMLLASVVEQVTGNAFAAELHERVFDPLEMTGSFATADDPRTADMATGHQQWFGQWRPVELPYDDAGVAMGYIASTASDLAKFMQAHLEGHPAIPASAAQIGAGPVAPTEWTTTLDAGYRHGWFVDELAGTPVVSHPGSLGHFTAHVLLASEADGLGVAVVSNASSFVSASHETQYDIGMGLMHMLLGEEFQPAEPPVLMTIAVPILLWLIVALLVASIIRFVVRLRRCGVPAAKGHGARGWFRALLPGVVYLAIGAGLLLAAPLGLARHFYPDGGWAVTVIAYVTTAWGVARLGTGLIAARRSGRPGNGTSTGRTSDRSRTPTATPGERHPEPLRT